ncbi:MAG: glucosyl-3-phosphoglycerate synthase [Nocardioidaceae bacterium]
MSGTGGLSPEVARWFARRTSVSDQWCRKRLVEAKGRTRVSVVLPARNEAPTVGAIVTALRRELMEDLPLIDELVVIDSQSTDATAEVAARAGARVVSQGDALPRMGDVPGKGEALWKSLLVTDGDIVAFIDADLRRFDAQFAVALLGPLLSNRDVGFVKAFYDRPLAAGTTLMPAGGGRVTELVARPLLNEHWPVLAGIIQPLAGSTPPGASCSSSCRSSRATAWRSRCSSMSSNAGVWQRWRRSTWVVASTATPTTPPSARWQPRCSSRCCRGCARTTRRSSPASRATC